MILAWKLADKLHLYYLFRTNSMLVSAVLIHQRYFIRIFSQDYISYDMKSFCVSHKMTHTMMLVYPMYPFTMHSLRGTLSVGWADRFSLWVVFYVYDEWFMGKLRGSLDFLHTTVILNA